MRKIFFLILVISILCGCSNNTLNVDNTKINSIDVTTVFAEIDNDETYIIDVREIEEYNNGHIRNSYNIPLGEINNVDEIIELIDSKIIVYCQSGNRSRMAAEQLLKMGYTNVYDMGGISSWNYELVIQ